jgi:hypothetical protein
MESHAVSKASGLGKSVRRCKESSLHRVSASVMDSFERAGAGLSLRSLSSRSPITAAGSTGIGDLSSVASPAARTFSTCCPPSVIDVYSFPSPHLRDGTMKWRFFSGLEQSPPPLPRVRTWAVGVCVAVGGRRGCKYRSCLLVLDTPPKHALPAVRAPRSAHHGMCTS